MPLLRQEQLLSRRKSRWKVDILIFSHFERRDRAQSADDAGDIIRDRGFFSILFPVTRLYVTRKRITQKSHGRHRSAGQCLLAIGLNTTVLNVLVVRRGHGAGPSSSTPWSMLSTRAIRHHRRPSHRTGSRDRHCLSDAAARENELGSGAPTGPTRT